MKGISFLHLLWICFSSSWALFSNSIFEGNYAATGGAGAATGQQRFANVQNPAAFEVEHMGLQFDYAHPYGLLDVTELGAGFFRDGVRLGFGFHYQQLNATDIYFEHKAAMQMSWHFLSNVNIGFSGGILKMETVGFAGQTSWSSGQGLLWSPLPALTAGVYLHSIFTEQGTLIPAYNLGLALHGLGLKNHQAVQHHLFLDWKYSQDKRGSFLLGQSLNLFSCLEINAGLAENPFQFSMGLALHFDHYRVQQAWRTHSDLGTTHYSGLGLDFKSH